MNKKVTISFLIAAGFYLSACQKNIDVFVPEAGQLNGPDTSWYSTISSSMPISQIKSDLSLATYTDSIQANTSTAYVLTPFGLQCGFPPLSFVSTSGQTITGTVHIETMLIKKKGDMIRMNTPTTSYNRLLVSGGEVFIRANKNGNPVLLAPGIQIFLRFPDVPLNPLMKYFIGDESNAERFNWLPESNTSSNTVSVGSQFYEISSNHLHWINCDYFYDTTSIARVTVKADLANYFTNANTIVYTVFKDFRSVVGMYGDVNTRKFSTGKLPVGKAITVVVISKQGNDYFLGTESTITVAPTSGPAEQSVLVKPVKKSLAEIITFLNSL